MTTDETFEAPAEAPPHDKLTPTVMTVGDLAAYLQVSKKTVYALANAGDLPVMKIGGDWRFYRPLVDRWLIAKSLETYNGPDLSVTNGDQTA